MNIKDVSKMTLLATAIAGAPAVFAAGDDRANSDATSSRADTTMQRDGNVASGNSVLPGSASENARAQSLAETDENARAGTHVQILTFEQDAVTLSDTAQTRLDNLAQTLDKDTPTNVVVKIEREGASGTGQAAANNYNVSSSDENLADSSGANQTVGSADSDYNSRDNRLNQEIEDNQRLISEHRAERVRQFLEDRDVQVSQFDVTQGNEQNPAIEQARPADEDTQDVLIVISDEANRGGLSAR